MKRNFGKKWAAALVLAICAADAAGIYIAQMRLHQPVAISARDTAYASADAIKDTWRTTRSAPEAKRVYASAAPEAMAPAVTPVMPAARFAPAPQRLAKVMLAVPAFKPRTDAFLAPPRLAEAAPAERVELATAIHAEQHRSALHRIAARLTQRNAAPLTSQSFTAAFGNGSAPVVVETGLGKQAEAGNANTSAGTSAETLAAITAPTVTAIEIPRVDLGDAATIGASKPGAVDTAGAELPPVLQPGN